jgi:hypothetical protein
MERRNTVTKDSGTILHANEIEVLKQWLKEKQPQL